MELQIKLDALDFSDRTPTKAQIENTCGYISDFLQKMGGSLMATGEYTIKDPFMQHLFNGASALAAAKDTLGQNASNLAIPRVGGPQPVPGR